MKRLLPSGPLIEQPTPGKGNPQGMIVWIEAVLPSFDVSPPEMFFVLLSILCK